MSLKDLHDSPSTIYPGAAASGIIGIHGRRGVGKSRLAASLMADIRHLYVAAATVPDIDQRALVLQSARIAGLTDVPDSDAQWEDIIAWLPSQGVTAVVFDGLGTLQEGNRRFLHEVSQTWTRLARSGVTLTLVFVDEDLDVLEVLNSGKSPFSEAETGSDGPDAEVVADLFRVDPLDYGALARHCPNWSAEDVITGYAIFGGLPGVVAAVDPSRRLGANVARLVLAPTGPFSSLPVDHLRGRFQSPARYAAIVRALALGAETWKGVSEGVPDLRGAGPLAPYLKRLEAIDVVRVRRSLDAAPNSRRRRYGLSDPFDQFWWSLVLPLRSALVSGVLDAQRAWVEYIEPALVDHVARVFPLVCRQFLAGPGLGPSGSKAREVGALWGDGYDVPVAGTLERGSIVYGDCHWHQRRPTEDWLDRLQQQVRKTRYGFGREARIRLLFTREQPKERLRQALLRSELIQRVGPTEMVAAARRVQGPVPS